MIIINEQNMPNQISRLSEVCGVWMVALKDFCLFLISRWLNSTEKDGCLGSDGRQPTCEKHFLQLLSVFSKQKCAKNCFTKPVPEIKQETVYFNKHWIAVINWFGWIILNRQCQ